VETAVDVVGVAGDDFRGVAHEEGAEGADVLELDRLAQRGAFARLGQQLIESGNAGSGTGQDRPGKRRSPGWARPELGGR
jgi:hypothetical protein